MFLSFPRDKANCPYQRGVRKAGFNRRNRACLPVGSIWAARNAGSFIEQRFVVVTIKYLTNLPVAGVQIVEIGAKGSVKGKSAVSPVVTVRTRADKGWAVKRARPSKNVWCSGLGLCLEMSLVFDFGQGLRCGLYIRHCRCHWIMAAWFVFLHFFLVPLC